MGDQNNPNNSNYDEHEKYMNQLSIQEKSTTKYEREHQQMIEDGKQRRIAQKENLEECFRKRSYKQLGEGDTFKVDKYYYFIKYVADYNNKYKPIKIICTKVNEDGSGDFEEVECYSNCPKTHTFRITDGIWEKTGFFRSFTPSASNCKIIGGKRKTKKAKRKQNKKRKTKRNKTKGKK